MAKNKENKPKKSEKWSFFKKDNKQTLKKQELEKKNAELEQIEREKFQEAEKEKQRQKQAELEKAELETNKELLELQKFLDKDFTNENLDKLSLLEKRKLLEEAKKIKEKADFEESGAEDFLDNINKIVEKFPSRLSASKNERKAGLLIKNLSQQKLKNKGCQEPFFIKRFANSYSTIFFAGLILFSFCFIFTYPVVSLVFYIFTALLFVFQNLFKVNVFSVFFKKTASFNIVNRIKSKKEPNKTLVLASHYDCPFNWTYSFKGKKLFNILLITEIVLNVLTFILLILLASGFNHVALLTITGIVMSLSALYFGFFYNIFSKKKTKNIKYGLNGVAMALSMTKYIVDNDLADDTTQIVFLSLASEQNSGKGSEAFISQHLGKDETLINPTVINFDSCLNNNVSITKKSIFSKKENNAGLRDMAYTILEKNNIKATKDTAIFNGHTAYNFEKSNIKTLQLTYNSKEIPDDLFNGKDNKIMTLEEAKKMFIVNKQIVDETLKNMNS